MEASDLAPVLACAHATADYWLNRYQTLIVGIIALYIAGRQAQISKRQVKIMADQIDQETQIAMLSLDKALSAMGSLSDRILSHPHKPAETDAAGNVTNWHWAGTALAPAGDFNLDWDEVQARLAMARRYPEHLDTFVAGVDAFKDVLKLAAEYKTEQWEDCDEATTNPNVDHALNRFWQFANMAPGWRAGNLSA